jgi:hypothetical protein
MPELEPEPDVDPARSASRSDLLPEERGPGSDDPDSQATAILEDSEVRQGDRDAAPDAVVEHRRSEDTVEPPD